jgi:hypothetical protein
MSGPIVRRYGFPNFDRIFGKKEIEHGVDEPEAPAEPANPPADKPAEPAKDEPKAETKPDA